MRDLPAWHRLHAASDAASADDDVPGLVAALDRAAALELAERWPYMAAAAARARHPDARIRRAVLGVLAGGAGLPAERLILAGLHDGEPVVRRAALDALVASCAHDDSRWLHAIVHPDPDIRRAAGLQAPRGVVELWVRLLADPQLRQDVLGRLAEGDLPPAVGPALVQHLGAGHLTLPELGQLLTRLPWRRRLTAIVSAFWWDRGAETGLDLSPEALPATLAQLAARRGGVDTLVDVLCALGHAEPDLLSAITERLLERARSGSLPAVDEKRLALGILAWIARHPERQPHPDLVALAGLVAPAVFGLPGLSTAVRRDALGCLAGTRRSDIVAVPLSALGRTALAVEGSKPVLRAMAGLVAIGPPDSLAVLARGISRRALVDALVGDPEVGGRLLAAGSEDASVEARDALLRRAVERHGPRSAPLLAATWARSAEAGRIALAVASEGTLDALVLALDELALSRTLKQGRASRVAAAIAARVEPVLPFLRHLLVDLGLDGPVTLGVVAEGLRHAPPAVAVLGLGEAGLARLAELDGAHGFLPWPVIQGLADACERPADPSVADWLAPIGRKERRKEPAGAAPARPLTDAEVHRIETCRDASLLRAVTPALAAPVTGLAAALAARDDPGLPQPETCAALLVCHDPLEEVAAQLLRFGLLDPAVGRRVDSLLVEGWTNRGDMGVCGAAWLHRWDAPLATFIAWAQDLAPGLRGALSRALALPLPALRATWWQAVRSQVGRWRWRAPQTLRERVDQAFIDAVVAALSDSGSASRGPLGYPVDGQDRSRVQLAACEILASLHGAGFDLASVRPEVVAALPDLPARARAALGSWVSSDGVASRRGLGGSDVPADASQRILAATTAAELLPFCLLSARSVAELAVLALLDLGEAGAAGLLGLLIDPDTPHRDLLGQSVLHWPDGPTLARARAACGDADLPPEARFHLCLALVEGGDRTWLPAVVRAIIDGGVDGGEDPWLQPAALQRVRRVVDDDLALALQLVESPEPTAVAWAVELLCLQADQDQALDGLRRFLLQGPARSADLRVEAADRLRRHGDPFGLPVLLAERMGRARAHRFDETARDWAQHLPAWAVVEATEAALLAGEDLAPGVVIVDGLGQPPISAETRESAALVVLREARSPETQAAALRLLHSDLHRLKVARRLAEVFLWGRDQARRLTGALYRIELIGGRQLGWTRIDERAIYVNPLPLLRGERDGAAVLRGLIVHELGHHLFNGDAEGKAVWKRAERQRLARLHNLVCDEHLERRLRSRDSAYGDDLKRLGAWAFQHAPKELPALLLTQRLGAATVPVLATTRLTHARQRGQVGVTMGTLFRALESEGDSFGRFVRALRMGLGNRHGDPKVDAALALFGRGSKGESFKARDNEGLWEVTLALREIFGDGVGVLDLLDLHGTCEGGAGEELIDGRGVTGEEIQRQVERLDLDRIEPKKRGEGRRGGSGGKDVVNIGKRVDFDRIRRVVPLAWDPAAARLLARDVTRPARKLRELLLRLGIATEEVRPRVSGHRIDRSRLVPLVVRADPRVLVSRRRVFRSDLFIGLVVDCSGSMGGRRIERARRFAALVAEACKGLRRVDLRVFGFTDSTIYDAGDARRCAAHGLEVGGGNNDAAGLWHAAQVAGASARTARLLVMVSDGLPTECSTTALQGLVRVLQRRRGIVCAQVAVAPLHERCFDTYVEVLDDDIDRSVRAFGRVVGGLVGRTLASAR